MAVVSGGVMYGVASLARVSAESADSTEEGIVRKRSVDWVLPVVCLSHPIAPHARS